MLEIELCPWLVDKDTSSFLMLDEPVTDWRINLAQENSEPDAWLLINRDTVEFLTRTF